MTIVLVGFNCFGGLSVNPSEAAVHEVAERTRPANVTLITEVLPTEFEAAGAIVRELVYRSRPDGFLIVGVAPGINFICLERISVNIDDAQSPDNKGEIRRNRLIEPGGPVAYWSTLPLDHLSEALARCGLPVAISNHAGAFVCNHAFYEAHHEIERLQLNTLCGLIHIPLMTEQIEASRGSVASLPLAAIINAIECSLNVLREELISEARYN